MSYGKIINPLDGKSYSIFEKEGGSVLKKYINQIKKGGMNPSDKEPWQQYIEDTKGYEFKKQLGTGGIGGRVYLYEKDGKQYAVKQMISDANPTTIKTKLVNEIIKDRINGLVDDNNMKENCDFVLNYSKVIYLSEENVENYLEQKLNKTVSYANSYLFLSEALDTDLHDYSNEKMGDEKIKFIVCQLIYALYCLHEIGITHGDLKPKNIFIKYDKRTMPLIKIADMDGSKIHNLSDSEINKIKIPESYKKDLNKVSAATNRYLPETHIRYVGKNNTPRVNFKIEITKKEDIYALGKILEDIKNKQNRFESENSIILNNDYFTNLITSMLDEDASKRPKIKDIYSKLEIIELCKDVKKEFGMKGELGFFMNNLKMEKDVNELINTAQVSNIINEKYDGFTALHLACNGGLEDIVNSLLEKKADVNSQDKFGYLPQHWAAQKGYVNIVNSLIENNADVDRPTSNGLTMLHLACKNEIEPLVLFLINKNEGAGANKDIIEPNFKLKAIDMTSNPTIKGYFNETKTT